MKSVYYERYFCEDRRACARRILKVMGKQLQDTQIEFRFPDELPMKHALYGLWLRVHGRIGEFNVEEGDGSTNGGQALLDSSTSDGEVRPVYYNES